jgi:hypothetical protein
MPSVKSKTLMASIAILGIGVGVAGHAAFIGSGTGRAVRASGPAQEETSASAVADLRAENESLRREIEGLRSAVVAAPPTESSEEEQAQLYLTRINAAPSWREAWLIVGNMVAEVSPERARDIMRTIWTRIDDPQKRQQILKHFALGEGHPYALDVLHLAATDPEMDLRSRAYFYLKQYAYIDFSEDPAAYPAWRRQYADRPLAEVLKESLRAFFGRLRR